MLKKNPELNIDPKKPFASDALDRKPAIELLTKLLQSTSQPFVLSVEAPFGFGKTCFLNLWKAHLELEGHLCLHFNAWENDFVEDPMVAFLGEMDRALHEAGKDKEGFPIAELWKDVSRHAGKIVRAGLPAAIQIGTLSLVKSESVKEVLGAFSEPSVELAKNAGDFMRKKLADYESTKKTIKGFRKALGKFATDLAKEEKKKKPIVFFIDELDRCRPDFAVLLLERIKHLFQVEGFFFVLGMDREQLGHSVRTLYGQGMDANGYLRRFMDFSFRLPAPRKKNFAEILFDRFQLEDIFDGGTGSIKSPEFVTTLFNLWAKHFGLSLRLQEQAFTDLNLYLRTKFSGNESEIVAAAFLLCFKAWNEPQFRLLIAGKIPLENIAKLVPTRNDNYFGFVEAMAVLCDPRFRQHHERSQMLQERITRLDINDPIRNLFMNVQGHVGSFASIFPGRSSGIVEHLELLSHFRGEHLE